MEISYDKESDALYIEFTKKKFSKYKKVDEFIILDIDKDGKIIGIEFLKASERLPRESFSEVHMKAVPA